MRRPDRSQRRPRSAPRALDRRLERLRAEHAGPAASDADPGRGLRLTKVRRQVLAAFVPCEEPIDFREVCRRVDPQLPMSMHATIYRSLNYFLEHRRLVEFTRGRRRLFALPTREAVTIVSGGASVEVEGLPIAAAIIESALEAGLPVGGRRIVIYIDAD